MEASNKLTIPLAIVIAGALIAGALYFVNRDTSPSPAAQNENNGQIDLKPVNEDDHILGNPNAEIVIVEFSDTECPFCKDFHNTMHRIIDEYGPDGQVAWVYRHFPIAQLHPKAPKQAEALECAAELGGNSGFWDYTDRLYEITPSNNGLDMNLLPVIAEEVGLDRTQFENCVNSERHAETVQADFDDAVASGGRGTPHSLLVTAGQIVEIPGAQPYASLRSAIDSILSGAHSGAGDSSHQAVPAL